MRPGQAARNLPRGLTAAHTRGVHSFVNPRLRFRRPDFYAAPIAALPFKIKLLILWSTMLYRSRARVTHNPDSKLNFKAMYVFLIYDRF